ncbi:Sec-independent protein translocase subunit TatA [Streptomyces sp. NPDC058739]|uniref:Sec-independent protein translocase subunit TatA n=1 Tax=Streptomyces sp. NPDC058739 TaxID=3346618 RepID=UPI00368812AA
MIGNLKPLELLLIIAVIALLFGAKKLPDMARSLGKSARILKSEARAMKKDGESAQTPQAPADAAPQTAPRTIAAAPGDVQGARPLTEPNHSVQS